jgi:integrase
VNQKRVKGADKVDKSDALSQDEERALLGYVAKNAPPMVGLYFEFAFATGMRPEELIELKWADVDVNAELPIARITRARSLGEVRAPKNNELRSVELSERAVGVLMQARAHTYSREDGYVFVNPVTGSPWNSTASQRDHYWNPAMKALGLRHRTPYSTRHTRASRMLMASCSPAWAARQLGHSKEMFFRIYADWIELDGDIIFPRGNGALRFAEDCKTYGPRLATDLLDHEGPQNQPIGHKPRSLPSEPLPEAA